MITTLLFLAAASSSPIDVGKFDPSAFPNAVKVDRLMPVGDLTDRADAIMNSGRCSFPGQSVGNYSISIPYAVLIQPSGEITKMVVMDVSCPEFEILTGQVARELVSAGDFRRTRAPSAQWYVSEVHYAHGGRDLARSLADDDKIVCESPRAETGSHLARTRLCLTKAQWRVRHTDQLRMAQDFGNQGDNLKVDPAMKPEPKLGHGSR